MLYGALGISFDIRLLILLDHMPYLNTLFVFFLTCWVADQEPTCFGDPDVMGVAHFSDPTLQ